MSSDSYPNGAGIGLKARFGSLPWMLSVTAVALLLSGCPKSPISSEEAAQMLFSQLWAEDQLVYATCRTLEAGNTTDMASVLSIDQLVPAAKAELLREMVENHSSMLSALGIDLSVCSPSVIVQDSLISSGVAPHTLVNLGLSEVSRAFDQTACVNEIRTRFNQLEAALSGNQPADTNSMRLFQAIRTAGVTAEQLVSDPLRLARLIDLSPAVIYTVIYFADQISNLTDQLSGGFSFAQGFVRLVLDEVAAEMLAVTTNRILDQLEAATLISRASVSRNACRLYEQATSRPGVTVRLLKRMVLRFEVPAVAQQQAPYAITSFCNELADRDVCEDMASELEMDDLIPQGGQGLERYAELAPALPALEENLSQRPATDWSEQILQAAEICPEPCTVQSINETASVLAFAEQQPQVLPEAVMQEIVSQIQAGVHSDIEILRQDVQSLQQEVAATRQSLSALVNLYREGASSADVLRRDLIDTIMRLSNCQAEWETVRRARVEFVQNVLQIDQVVSCEGGPDFYQSVRFPSVRVPSGAVCDPSQAFDFDISTDSLFDTCDDRPLAEGTAMLQELAGALVQLRPQAIMVIGHADQRPIESRSCLARFTNNTVLSESRAQQVGNLIGQSVSGQLPSLRIESIGVGDIDPRENCPAGASDDCHRKNRRVTLRMVGAAGVGFTFRCVGGR